MIRKNKNWYWNLTILSFFMVVFMVSCELLDPKPTDSIPDYDAIKDAQGVRKAITGCYDILQSPSYYGRSYMLFGDIPTTNLSWTGVNMEFGEINNDAIPVNNFWVADAWLTLYNGINRVNNVLINLPEISDMSSTDKDLAYGECYFLRGLHHYNLLRLWGAVPIKLKPSTGNLAELQVPRDPVDSVYSQVLKDLSKAEIKLPAVVSKGYAGQAAVRSMLALVYLNRYNVFGNATDLDSALIKANLVIVDPAYFLESDYTLLFSTQDNGESIFEITFNIQDRNDLAIVYFSRPMAGLYEFAPTSELIASFEPGDTRKEATIAMDSTGVPYGYKYRDMSGGTSRVYVVRLAELYLIRAEVNVYRKVPFPEIQSDINRIRQRAGLPATTAGDYESLGLAIENERQHEFALEGKRWFDLTRTDRAIQILPKVTSRNQYLFPIPQAEIQSNRHPGMYQNPGY